MDKQLRIHSGPDAGRCYPLPQAGSFSIGRSHQHSDCCLHDLECSRVHCYLEIEGDQVTIVAPDADTKVLVNGEPTLRRELTPSDKVQIGSTTFAFEFPYMPHLSPPVAAPPAEPGLPALEGQTLGHYELGPILGQGHHGVVFRARDTQHRRDVALKVLRPEFPGCSQELTRFSMAYKQVLPLRHPNLVALYGVGKTGHHVWLALELIDGSDLGRLLKEKDGQPLDWRLALRVAIDIGQALEFLWEQRVGHRNLTPANILWDKKARQASLNDLGFGTALKDSALRREVREKKLAAELPYLAPEQASPGTYVDDKVDVYRLGAVLYTLLTGRPPFQGQSTEQTIELIQKGKLERPRARQKGIPAEFERVVLKMLARRQEDRYHKASDMLSDLEAVDDGLQTAKANGGKVRR